MKSWVKDKFNTVSVALSGLLAVPYGKQLEKFVSNIINETPTIYDKAIDKNCIYLDPKFFSLKDIIKW